MKEYGKSGQRYSIYFLYISGAMNIHQITIRQINGVQNLRFIELTICLMPFSIE